MNAILKKLQVRKYRALLLTDAGPYYLAVYASGKDAAVRMIMQAENCPRRAISKIWRA